jgi:sporulation protein YlmC with PRC-barrel domain
MNVTSVGEVAGWLACAVTLIAALMTAGNFGARITGWGFALFTFGALCWVIVGYAGGDKVLLVTNIVLTLINAFGVWRWLGPRTRYETLGTTAEDAGKHESATSVFAATSIAGRKIIDSGGNQIGEAVEAIIDADSGLLKYVIVRFGGVAGVGETLVSLQRDDIYFNETDIITCIDEHRLAALPPLEPHHWPDLLSQGES